VSRVAVRSVPVPPAPGERSIDWSEEEIERASHERGHLKRVLRDLARTPPLLAGLALLSAFAGIAVFETLTVPSLATIPSNPRWFLAVVNPPGPSPAHPFGVLTGPVAADLLAALLQATPWDLLFLGTILGGAFAIGTAIGVWAGYAGGFADAALTALTDLMLAVPPFFLVIIFYLGVLGLVPATQDLDWFVGFFVLVLVPYYARPVRARAERVSREPYVEAARAAGARDAHILRRHILPNSLFPVFAQVPVDLYNVFFVLTVFPFLACQPSRNFQDISPLPANFPEWGNLLAQGTCSGWQAVWAANAWWMYLFPALVIVLFGLAVMLTCDGLERMLHGRTQTA
jgi:peptide/nickel transport system permease protein